MAILGIDSAAIYRNTYQIINLFMVVGTALAIWKGGMVLTWTESPVVVVLSGSMEPGYSRGDLLFLSLWTAYDPLKVGDVVIYRLEGREVPIVHRMLWTHEPSGYTHGQEPVPRLTEGESRPLTDTELVFLTKGDNNTMDDLRLYNPGQEWLVPQQLLGRVGGYFPSMGMLTIWFNDYPALKVIVLGVLAVFVLITG